jgi:hypothetical protein
MFENFFRRISAYIGIHKIIHDKIPLLEPPSESIDRKINEEVYRALEIGRNLLYLKKSKSDLVEDDKILLEDVAIKFLSFAYAYYKDKECLNGIRACKDTLKSNSYDTSILDQSLPENIKRVREYKMFKESLLN